MTDVLKCRLAARCEAAGRPNNEDNYNVIADITKGSGFIRDKIINLGIKGTLLLVCDGMGGMNAGEVASDIAVKTITQWFEANRITDDVLANDSTRCDYIRKAIQDADANIKNEGRIDTSKSGMGSTVVMAWLLDDKAYVGWCGDSRAYKYNPTSGLMQMSHDHSYVQELVDAGKLAPELAFDHPNGNIITRSLGDPRGAAQPDVKVFQLAENDIILLCSDGLCGVLRNNEIENIVKSNTNSMNGCRDALWEAARDAGWHDNVTIVLAQIMPKETAEQNDGQKKKEETEKGKDEDKTIGKKGKKALIVSGVILIAAVLIYIVFTFIGNGSTEPKNTTPTPDPCDKIEVHKAVEDFIIIDINNLKVEEGHFDGISNNLESIICCDTLKSKLEKHLKSIINYKDPDPDMEALSGSTINKCKDLLNELQK